MTLKDICRIVTFTVKNSFMKKEIPQTRKDINNNDSKENVEC